MSVGHRMVMKMRVTYKLSCGAVRLLICPSVGWKDLDKGA